MDQDQSAPVVRSDLPLPPARRGSRRGAAKSPERLAIEALTVGQCAEFPAPYCRVARRDFQQQLGSLAWQITRASGGALRFSTRLIESPEGCKVGVWRTR